MAMDSGLIDSSTESMISVVEATVTKDSCPTVKPEIIYKGAKRPRGGGGFILACVPGCYSNSKREKHLFLHDTKG